MTDFICIAHRGASGLFPENTLLAFRKALEMGACWLELDVQLSADGELVVIHDESLERTTNGHGLVAQQPLAVLRQLDAGQGEQVPLLAEVLDLARGRANVNIELKGIGTGEPVARMLQQRFLSGQTKIKKILASSLNEKELRSLSALLPQLPLALVAERVDKQIWQSAEELGVWSLNLEKSCIDSQLVAKARAEKRKVLAYTVNDVQELKRLKGCGIAGVFTDFPDLLSQQ